MTTATLAPPEWDVSDGTVRLVDVQRSANLPYPSVAYAVRQGVIPVAGHGGVGNARRVTVDDALMILAVAALAAAVGAAFVTVLRAVRENGGKLTPAGLTIPVKFAA